MHRCLWTQGFLEILSQEFSLFLAHSPAIDKPSRLPTSSPYGKLQHSRCFVCFWNQVAYDTALKTQPHHNPGNIVQYIDNTVWVEEYLC